MMISDFQLLLKNILPFHFMKENMTDWPKNTRQSANKLKMHSYFNIITFIA